MIYLDYSRSDGAGMLRAVILGVVISFVLAGLICLLLFRLEII